MNAQNTPAVKGLIESYQNKREEGNRGHANNVCRLSYLQVLLQRIPGKDFLADLEGNPDPAIAWNLIKSLSQIPPFVCFFKKGSNLKTKILL